MKDYVVGFIMGRCGNQFYQIANAYAYSLKHDLDFFITSYSKGTDNGEYYFKGLPTRDNWHSDYHEKRDANGYAIYEEIPKLRNVCLVGYWQSFDYFNEYRTQILDLLKIPYNRKDGYVSLHVRRGDYLNLSEKLKLTSVNYYKEAIKHFTQKGDYKFLVFSDDIGWCMQNLPELLDAKLEFFDGKDELEDLAEMSSCEHNICANSTFSYVASWLNRNTEKEVISPTFENMFKGMCLKMIPDNYITINA